MLLQIHNVSSSLYSGNVTVFVDSSWGVSGQGKGARKSNPYLAIKSYEPSSYSHRDSTIERCKDVQVIIIPFSNVHTRTNSQTIPNYFENVIRMNGCGCLKKQATHLVLTVNIYFLTAMQSCRKCILECKFELNIHDTGLQRW